MTNYRFDSGTFCEWLWLVFVMILRWYWCCIFCCLWSWIHVFRRYVWLLSSDDMVQRGTMVVSRPERDIVQRGTGDMRILVPYFWSHWFWHHMHMIWRWCHCIAYASWSIWLCFKCDWEYCYIRDYYLVLLLFIVNNC